MLGEYLKRSSDLTFPFPAEKTEAHGEEGLFPKPLPGQLSHANTHLCCAQALKSSHGKQHCQPMCCENNDFLGFTHSLEDLVVLAFPESNKAASKGLEGGTASKHTGDFLTLNYTRSTDVSIF